MAKYEYIEVSIVIGDQLRKEMIKAVWGVVFNPIKPQKRNRRNRTYPGR